MEQLSRTVLRNSAFGMSAQLVIKLLSFGFSILIVRNLGASSFGQYAGVVAFATVFYFIADAGLSPYAVREVARWRDLPGSSAQVNALYTNTLYLRILLTLLATAITLVVAWLTGRPPVMIVGIALNSIGLLMWALHGTNSAVLSGLERLDLTSGASVINQVVFVGFGALALYLGFGYYGLLVASVVGTAGMTLFCWRIIRKLDVQLKRPDLRGWIPLLAAAFPFGIMTLAQNLSYNFDSVMLNVVRGDAETGYYNAAYSLVFSVVVISNVLNTTLYPSLMRHSVSNAQSLPDIYQRALRYLMLISIPIAVGTWALANQIVPFLYRNPYLPAVPALQIIIWVVPFMFASEFLGYVVFIKGHEKHAARAITASAVFNILLNLFFVPRFGFIAAAALTVITEVILVGQYLWILDGDVRSFDWGRILIRPLVAALLMGSLALALSFIPLLVNIAISGTFYVILLLLFGVLGGDEVRMVRMLGRRTEERAVQ